jgi:hypothetical protein
VELPFATLERARDATRQLKSTSGLPDGGVTVYLRAGTYQRTATFDLLTQDSGSADSPITYQAYNGEAVRLVGATPLESSWFSLVTSSSPVWSRLDAPAKGNLMQVSLPAHGITNYGALQKRAGWGTGWTASAALELFFNGQPMPLGRTADGGFEFVVDTPSSAKFTYSGTEPERWGAAEDIWIHGNLGAYWFNEFIKVSSINTATKTITLAATPQYAIKAGKPYYMTNLLEEIDTPGEWYLNRSTGTLYFWPSAPLASSEVYVSLLDSELLRMTNTQNVTFQGITFEMSRENLVEINGGSDNTLRECVLRNAGVHGAVISGFRNGLDRCEVYSVGEYGVWLSGGDRPTLTAAGNFVRNSDLHDWGRWVRATRDGIHLEGVGQIVSHNVLHDAPYMAVLYTGNNHLIEYNDIYGVCNETSDGGAIYSGRDWSYRGNVIRYNFIHDMTSPFTPWEIYGVYLDDAVGSAEVYGNIFYNLGYATLNLGGRDNIFYNNVMYKCYGGHRADRRGVDIITDNNDGFDFLYKLNLATGESDFHNNAAWMQAYPALQIIPNNFNLLGDLKNPGGSVFTRNFGAKMASSSKWMNEGTWGGPDAFDWYADTSNNLYGTDPLFVDEANRNMTLRPDSPVFTIPGFEPIPFDQIGIEPKEPSGETTIIVDNKDTGFTVTGTWGESAAVDEYNGSSRNSSVVGSTAAWRPELPYAGTYQVWAWWSAKRADGTYYDRDSAADYVIHHSGGTTTVVVDQDLNSGQWNLLGTFSFQAGTAGHVELLRNSANGLSTIADAVKFVVAEASQVPQLLVRYQEQEIVSGDLQPGSEDGTDFGTAYQNGPSVERRFTIQNDGTGELIINSLQLTSNTGFAITEPPPASIAAGSSATFALTMLVDSPGNKSADVVLQTNDPQNPTFTFRVAGIVSADPYPGIVVDNLDSGFSTTGTWKESNAVDEYNGSSSHSNIVGSSARWSPELPSDGTYQVWAWWSAERADGSFFDRDSAADYVVHHSSGATTVVVNQDLNSGQWNLLGTFTFQAGTAGYVELLRNSANGLSTIADAVKFVMTAPPEVIVDNLDAGFSTTGTWGESAAVDEYNGSSRNSNIVGNTARWTPQLLSTGTYEVWTWWSTERADGSFFDRDSAADYVIHYSSDTTMVVVDQDLNSGQWNLLGTFSFQAGTAGYVELLRNSANGLSTIADAVRFIYVGG